MEWREPREAAPPEMPTDQEEPLSMVTKGFPEVLRRAAIGVLPGVEAGRGGLEKMVEVMGNGMRIRRNGMVPMTKVGMAE